MNKLFPTVVIMALLLTSLKLNAQDTEVGLFIGASNYVGDLEQHRIHLEEANLAFGLLYRYYYNPNLNFKGNLYFGYVSGDDANYADDYEFMKNRNLSFRSPVLEASAQLEWNILPFVPASRDYRFSPYVFGGISVFYFNPQAEYDGEWHDLQPLGTEGQNLPDSDKDPYSRISIAIPMGIGIKYNISNLWNIGFEVGARKTFTDYLDDVSGDYADNNAIRNEQGDLAANLADRGHELGRDPKPAGSIRGNPDADDWYGFTGFTITRTIRSYPCNY